MLAIKDIPVIAFEQKKYKLCALLLFSLIDAKLIRFQKSSMIMVRYRLAQEPLVILKGDIRMNIQSTSHSCRI